jgi:phage repressor protein C with HTH and peptisase S24 domain
MNDLACQHRRVWAAIDHIAEQGGMSKSRLAIRSGLDSTSFNPSKRVGRKGRLRWPSTETVARVLDTVGKDFAYFAEVAERIR